MLKLVRLELEVCYRETYGSWRLFDSLDDCFNYIEGTYNVKTKIKN
jgi:hypothetical protein